MEPLNRLVAELRADAETYGRGEALVNGALLCCAWANRIESALRDYDAELLSVSEAARERGESYSTTYRKIQRGQIPNVGNGKHPKVRRCDLFAKQGPSGGPDLAGAVLSPSSERVA